MLAPKKGRGWLGQAAARAGPGSHAYEGCWVLCLAADRSFGVLWPMGALLEGPCSLAG